MINTFPINTNIIQRPTAIYPCCRHVCLELATGTPYVDSHRSSFLTIKELLSISAYWIQRNVFHNSNLRYDFMRTTNFGTNKHK